MIWSGCGAKTRVFGGGQDGTVLAAMRGVCVCLREALKVPGFDLDGLFYVVERVDAAVNVRKLGIVLVDVFVEELED